jgi:hypothetical protein
MIFKLLPIDISIICNHLAKEFCTISYGEVDYPHVRGIGNEDGPVKSMSQVC